MAAAEASGSGTLVIEAKGIAKSLGGRAVVRDFSTRVMRGDRVPTNAVWQGNPIEPWKR